MVTLPAALAALVWQYVPRVHHPTSSGGVEVDWPFWLCLAALVLGGAISGWLALVAANAWSTAGHLEALHSVGPAEARGRGVVVGGEVVPTRTFHSLLGGQELVFAEVKRFHEDARLLHGDHRRPVQDDPRDPRIVRLLPGFRDPAPSEQQLAVVTLAEPFYLRDGDASLLVDPGVEAPVPCALPVTTEDCKRSALELYEAPSLRLVDGPLREQRGISHWVERAVKPGQRLWVQGDVVQAQNGGLVLQPTLLLGSDLSELESRQSWRIVVAALGLVAGLLVPALLLLISPAAGRSEPPALGAWGIALVAGLLISSLAARLRGLGRARGLGVWTAILLFIAGYVLHYRVDGLLAWLQG
jgi:hypothetical protein